MPIDLSRYDGSKRPPRQCQVDVLRWLEQNWDKADVLACQVPTGVGKSFIARTVQRATGGQVIVPANVLMDQYRATYPKVNALKGREHYGCREWKGFSCEDRKKARQKPCKECPYREARRGALEGKATFYNPMSLYYVQQDPNHTPAKVVVVDEAHALIDMLLLLVSKRFPEPVWGALPPLNQLAIDAWLQAKLDKLTDLLPTVQADTVKFIKVRRDLEMLKTLIEDFRERPTEYVWSLEKDRYRGRDSESLYLRPLTVPTTLLKQMLNAQKVLLLSATLLENTATTLAAGRPYLRADFPSPIPKENRRVYYTPLPVAVNYKTPPEAYAAHLRALLARHPGQNVIVHSTYGLAYKLRPLLADVQGLITHDKDTKDAQLEVFKKQGGVFLASGCAEGIDLPGDLCRVNIVLAMQKGYLGDLAVKQRLAKQGGQDEYELDALQTVIQQVGRSTRAVEDRSTSYVCDPMFPTYFLKQKAKLPMSFTEAVVWRSPKEKKT